MFVTKYEWAIGKVIENILKYNNWKQKDAYDDVFIIFYQYQY
jgi:hypothetical protein